MLHTILSFATSISKGDFWAGKKSAVLDWKKLIFLLRDFKETIFSSFVEPNSL